MVKKAIKKAVKKVAKKTVKPKVRLLMNKADEAYINANLDKNSLEISEDIGLDQLVIAAHLKEMRAEKSRDPGRLRTSDGNIVGCTLTQEMAYYEPTKNTNDNLNNPYIFRRQNLKENKSKKK